MRRIKIIAVVIAALLTLTVLAGCWDSRELNKWFILTGTGLDVAEDPEKVYITFQIANIKQGNADESGGDKTSGGQSVITFGIASDSLQHAVSEINIDNDQKLLFQHNQIRLFGIELAERGIKDHLDLLLRDFQARLEVPMAVVDGRGEDILKLKLPHEPNSGIFMGGFLKDLSDRSAKYNVRLIDFVHMLLDGTAAPVMPILKITKTENDEKGVMVDGMAVFKSDKMIGRLDREETLGYLWSFGDIHNLEVNVTEGENRAALHISKLDCKRKLTINPDQSVEVDLKIDASLNIAEQHGFGDFKPTELLKHLEKLAQEKIKETIMGTFAKAKELKADFFGFCTMAQKHHPKEWEKMKDRWDEIFAAINLDIEVKTKIKGTGQIGQSLKMEEKSK